jgi:elongation factor Ts
MTKEDYPLADITAQMVKDLRQATGAGVLDCKKALAKADGDIEEATKILREKGLAEAQKRMGRAASEGKIGTYIHAGSRVAAMVELNCETDFAAGTDLFNDLAHDLAMHVVAARPLYLTPDDVPEEVLAKEKEIYRAQVAESGKPDHIVERIVEGKLNKFFDEVCLTRQPYVKNGDVSVEELIKESIAKLGENIVIRRFVRMGVGEEQ